MKNSFGKLEWFGGNEAALGVYNIFVELLHTWDDLVDGDRIVTEAQINQAFLAALVYLPANPFYKSIEAAILPMWISVVSSYETANHYERTKDAHGLEIGHSLRYAAGQIIAYAVNVCVGADKAREVMPEVWKTIVCERFQDYKREHSDEKKRENKGS